MDSISAVLESKLREAIRHFSFENVVYITHEPISSPEQSLPLSSGTGKRTVFVFPLRWTKVTEALGTRLHMSRIFFAGKQV